MRAPSASTVLLALAVGCGGGVDGKSISPQATPTPTTAPPAPAPRTPVGVDVTVVSTRPAGWNYEWDGYDGYVEGNTIRLIAQFEDPVSVQGSPRLTIEIGETDRHAVFSPWVEDDFPPERLSFKQRFEYMVHWEDRDDDGFSIGADAFDLADGAFLNTEGAPVEVEVVSVTDTRSGAESEPGTNLGAHRVLARQEPRVCSEEREMARAYGREDRGGPPLLEEWDGTPFRFYWDAGGVPESERNDAEHYFDVVERLAERIEDQIGYPILEVAGWIPEEARGFRITHPDIQDCSGVRPGGIVATVVPRIQKDSAGFVGAGTKSHCAVLFWTSSDIDTTLDGVMAHEIWHLFGFTHHPLSLHPNQTPPGVGVPMSIHLTTALGYRTPRELGVTYEDVDALRCVFPENGSPGF